MSLALYSLRIGGIARRQGGFSVMEVLVAMGMFSIMATAAGVGLGQMAPKFNIDNGARMVAMALSQARTLAITRGHVVEVTFGSDTFTITDTEEGEEGEEVATGQLPAHITMAAESSVSFTPLGTVSDSLDVTLSNGGEHDHVVRVSLTGEVQIGESPEVEP
jgi:type II secretion system protein H